jgi:phage tail sheath protein FI
MMAEYLEPGVYVEEVSYRSRVIEGVATLVVGMLIGVTASIAIDRLRRAGIGAGCGDARAG